MRLILLVLTDEQSEKKELFEQLDDMVSNEAIYSWEEATSKAVVSDGLVQSIINGQNKEVQMGERQRKPLGRGEKTDAEVDFGYHFDDKTKDN